MAKLWMQVRARKSSRKKRKSRVRFEQGHNAQQQPGAPDTTIQQQTTTYIIADEAIEAVSLFGHQVAHNRKHANASMLDFGPTSIVQVNLDIRPFVLSDGILKLAVDL